MIQRSRRESGGEAAAAGCHDASIAKGIRQRAGEVLGVMGMGPPRLPSPARRIRAFWQQTPIGCLSAMGAILLTVLTVVLGYGLGKGVPRLVQRSGSLARRSRGTQLAGGILLLLPWLVGIALGLQVEQGAQIFQRRVLLQLPAHRGQRAPRLLGRR